MKEIKVRVSDLESLPQRLDKILSVCEEAPDDPERGYPYATGYVTASIRSTIEEIQHLINSK
jgi:hypothetical protein